MIEVNPQVYFAQLGLEGLIKIGWTGNLENRLKQLEHGLTEDLNLIGSIPAGPEFEAFLHKRLSDWRVRGEWFEPMPEVKETVNRSIKDGAVSFGQRFATPTFDYERSQRAVSSGAADDVLKLQMLCEAISSNCTHSHRQMVRAKFLAEVMQTTQNRAYEMLTGRQRRVEAWEMERALDLLASFDNAKSARGSLNG